MAYPAYLAGGGYGQMLNSAFTAPSYNAAMLSNAYGNAYSGLGNMYAGQGALYGGQGQLAAGQGQLFAAQQRQNNLKMILDMLQKGGAMPAGGQPSGYATQVNYGQR